MTDCRTATFIAPFQIEIRDEPLPPLAANQVLVRTLLSAISPGTEMLVYRGQFPTDLALDQEISALGGDFSYPLKYGYCAVGQVIEVGENLDPSWMNRIVFAFNPHQSSFITSVDSLLPLPPDITPEQAVFLPNMETAVNFVMDGRPMIGERVTVLGQGIVGLLTTLLLSRFPLTSLVTLDRFSLRRQVSLYLGARASLDPDNPALRREALNSLGGEADLCYELSGSPAALDTAISLAGFASRILIGSWYGQKRHALDLGGRFHRSRIQLVSTQVSTISPLHSGRWDKSRRFELAWEMLRHVQPSRFITHRFPIQEAADAYRLIDQNPDQTIQVVLTYP